MIKAIDLRKGRTVLHEGELYIVHESEHVTRGKGRSLMQIKLKNYKTGVILDLRFNVDEKVETPFVDSKTFEYLYQDGEQFVLMDTENFEQVNVPGDIVGDATRFLKPNEKIACQIYEGQIISFELPFTVELEVTDTPPAIKGATATNQLKEAILETGAKVRVPPFVENGTVIRVDTRTGEYIERAK